MDREVNIIGMRFGMLTVLRFDHSGQYRSYYLCKCDCGNEALVCRQHLTSGKTKSCGCLRSTSINIHRGQFHRHTVTAEQIAWLEKHYRHTKNDDIKAKFGMTDGTLHRLARKYGWTKTTQFRHKCQAHAKNRAAESHRLNGTYPPKGYVIPNSSGNRFRPGEKPSRRLGAKRDRERIEKMTATMRDLRNRERARIKYGLPRLTNLNMTGDSARVHKWRHYLKRRGYIMGDDRYLFYYTAQTKRSPKLESGGNPFTFEPLKSQAV